MKKTYIQPKTTIVKLRTQYLLIGSIIKDGDNLNVTVGDDSFGDGETINARRSRFSTWEEE